MGTPRRIALAGIGAGVAAAAVLGWSVVIERHWFALRRATLPVLPEGSRPIRVLHLSDLHMLPRHRRKAAWVSALADLRPDLVINTGDTISSALGIPAAVGALGDLLDVPGAFVFGNNDFYRPVPKSPHRYFTRRDPVRRRADLPWQDLRAVQVERGWLDLNNQVGSVTVRGSVIALGGVGDPHTGRDHYERIEGAFGGTAFGGRATGGSATGGPTAGSAGGDAVVRIGLTHSPEPRVLDAFAADGYDLVLAGHTHGGQVRLPGVGALVTNCGIDRRRARGLSRWGNSMWLNVSAGLGNSPYMPVRFGCRPEATLLTLTARA